MKRQGSNIETTHFVGVVFFSSFVCSPSFLHRGIPRLWVVLQGNNLLHVAARRLPDNDNGRDLLWALLDRSPPEWANARNNSGQTPLLRFAKENRPKPAYFLQAFLELNVDINTKDVRLFYFMS